MKQERPSYMKILHLLIRLCDVGQVQQERSSPEQIHPEEEGEEIGFVHPNGLHHELKDEHHAHQCEDDVQKAVGGPIQDHPHVWQEQSHQESHEHGDLEVPKGIKKTNTYIIYDIYINIE